VLGPLNRASKNRQHAVQFGLSDLLCLFVLVQLPLGIMPWVIRLGQSQQRGPGLFPRNVMIIMMDVVLAIMTSLLWAACVQMLSKAGIDTVWRRCVVLAVVVPCTIAGAMAVPGFVIAAFCSLMDRQLLTAGWLLLALIPVVAILYGLGRFTRATVAAAKVAVVEQENREEV
jgi:hypothetical protein